MADSRALATRQMPPSLESVPTDVVRTGTSGGNLPWPRHLFRRIGYSKGSVPRRQARPTDPSTTDSARKGNPAAASCRGPDTFIDATTVRRKRPSTAGATDVNRHDRFRSDENQRRQPPWPRHLHRRTGYSMGTPLDGRRDRRKPARLGPGRGEAPTTATDEAGPATVSGSLRAGGSGIGGFRMWARRIFDFGQGYAVPHGTPRTHGRPCSGGIVGVGPLRRERASTPMALGGTAHDLGRPGGTCPRRARCPGNDACGGNLRCHRGLGEDGRQTGRGPTGADATARRVGGRPEFAERVGWLGHVGGIGRATSAEAGRREAAARRAPSCPGRTRARGAPSSAAGPSAPRGARASPGPGTPRPRAPS